MAQTTSDVITKQAPVTMDQLLEYYFTRRYPFHTVFQTQCYSMLTDFV